MNLVYIQVCSVLCWKSNIRCKHRPMKSVHVCVPRLFPLCLTVLASGWCAQYWRCQWSGGGWWAGRGFQQNVACAADQRATAVTSVTPGRKGLSASRQSCIGYVTQNWRLAEAERGSAELRGTLARSHRSLLPPLKLLTLPRPSSPPQLSAPHASHCQAWWCVFVCLCACAGMQHPPRLGPVCAVVDVCGCARVCVCVCLEWCLPLSSEWRQYTHNGSA